MAFLSPLPLWFAELPNDTPFLNFPLPLTLSSDSKQVLSIENELHLHESRSAGETHFDMNGLAGRLTMTSRKKATLKWPIMLNYLVSKIDQVSLK